MPRDYEDMTYHELAYEADLVIARLKAHKNMRSWGNLLSAAQRLEELAKLIIKKKGDAK